MTCIVRFAKFVPVIVMSMYVASVYPQHMHGRATGTMVRTTCAHTHKGERPAESWCTHPDRLHAHGSSPWRHAACEREERAWTKINSVAAKGKHGTCAEYSSYIELV